MISRTVLENVNLRFKYQNIRTRGTRRADKHSIEAKVTHKVMGIGKIITQFVTALALIPFRESACLLFGAAFAPRPSSDYAGVF